MASMIAEITWLWWLLVDFGVSVLSPTTVFSDRAMSIAHDPVKHELTKHIGVDASNTRSQVQERVITLQYMSFDMHLANFFTKPQTQARHLYYLSKLSVCDPS
uniref:Uncharacterized protein n=1 Tax=Arundo donax TaxID=35708 RepID=A0A0A9E046_ARUDO